LILVGVFRNADLNRLISSEEQKRRRLLAKRTFIEVCFQVFSWSLLFFKVFQGSCFCLKARLPASSDDDNVFSNAERMRLQRGNEKTKAIE